MDKKLKLIIGGSVAGTALVGLVVASIALANRPSALIVRALANTISDAQRIEAYAVGHDVVNGGSIAVSANLDKVAKDDIRVQGKLYSDAQNLRGACEFTMAEDDETILQTRLLYNQDKIAFTCPEIIDGAYGVNIKNIAKNLPGSIFDPDEETDYSLDEEQFDYFMNLSDTIKNDKNLERDTDKMVTAYRQLAINLFVKYSDVTRSSKTINIGDEKIPCTIISISADEQAVAQITQDLVTYAKKDESLEKYLRRVASNGSYYDDPDDIIDEFYDYLDDIEDEIENLENTDLEIRFDFYITKSGRRMARVDFNIELDDEGFESSLLLGKNVAKSKEISLEVSDIETDSSYSFVYSVEENSSRAYEAKLKFKEVSASRSGSSRTNETQIKISWDRRSGDFNLRATGGYDDYVVKGTLLQKGDRYIFVLTNIKSDGEAVPYVKSLELTITLDRHDTAPNVRGKFTDITKMDKRDFKHFSEDIEEGFEEIFEKYFD